MTVWVIAENGERVRLTDKFQPNVYVSGKQEDIERLASGFYANKNIASWDFAASMQIQLMLKIKSHRSYLKDCRRITSFTNEVLRQDYLVMKCIM